MVNAANAHTEAMRGMSEKAAMDYVRKAVAEHELVFGLWQDHSKTNGIDMMVAKGTHKLQAIMAEGDPLKMLVTAIPCIKEGQAIALYDVLGDGATKLS
jgi:hypothetical protein